MNEQQFRQRVVNEKRAALKEAWNVIMGKREEVAVAVVAEQAGTGSQEDALKTIDSYSLNLTTFKLAYIDAKEAEREARAAGVDPGPDNTIPLSVKQLADVSKLADALEEEEAG